MRALVTGAAGQVGSYLVDLLERRGEAVVGLDRAFPALAGPTSTGSTTRIIADVLDRTSLAGPLEGEPFDAIFHLAGLNALQTPEEIYRVNVVGTATLLSALRETASHARLIVMSSSAVYGVSVDNPIRETSLTAPQTNYAVSKLCAEMMAQVHGHEMRVATVIARPFNIVGPRQRAPLLYSKVAAQLAEIMRGDRPPVLELGNLESHRDFIDVRDVCEGLLAMAQHGQNGEVYNLCSAQATPIRHLVEHLCRRVDVPVEIRTTGRAGTGVDVSYQRGSHDKISALCGWHPVITLEKSLDDTLAYWQGRPSPSQ